MLESFKRNDDSKIKPEHCDNKQNHISGKDRPKIVYIYSKFIFCTVMVMLDYGY